MGRRASISESPPSPRATSVSATRPALETGVTLGWSSANSATKFGLGAKYVLEDGAVVRAEVNNNSEVGLGYQQKLRDGVTVTLSTLINGANFNAGGHKVGVSLEMSA